LRKGSGTGAFRKPGSRSGIRVVPADSVPPGTGRTPGAENPLVSFPPTRLGEEPNFYRTQINTARQSRNQKIFIGQRSTQINTDFISAKDVIGQIGTRILLTTHTSRGRVLSTHLTFYGFYWDPDEHGYSRIMIHKKAFSTSPEGAETFMIS
jgi:hypothetical protein